MKLDFTKRHDQDTLRDRYCDECPQFEYDMVVSITCLCMADPNHEKRLRDHTGQHPVTLLGVATHLPENELQWLAEDLDVWEKQCPNGLNLTLSPTCRKEKYRSIGCRELLNQ